MTDSEVSASGDARPRGGTARWSNPLSEQNAMVGRGAVLYDIREADRRPCCDQGGRCLAHVLGVYEETATDEVYFRVADGTHTTYDWVHQGDLLTLYEPAGWSIEPPTKPTYVLTRRHGVNDHHCLMTDGSGDSLGDVTAQINRCDEAHEIVEDTRLTVRTICEEVLPQIDAEANWTQEDLQALDDRIESVRDSLQDIELELITPETRLEKLAESNSVDSLEDIHGMTTVTVQCQNGDLYSDEDLHCDGWENEIELDAPASYDYTTEKIKLPGFNWECGECGQPHNFIVEGIGVSNLV